MTHTFGILPKKCFTNLRSQIYSSMIFVILSSRFRSVIHSTITIYGEDVDQGSFLCVWICYCSSTMCWKDHPLSIEIALHLYSWIWAVWLFSFLAFSFFFSFFFLFSFHRVSSAWDLLSILDSWGYNSHQIQKILGHYLFPCLLFPTGISVTYMIDCLILSHLTEALFV